MGIIGEKSTANFRRGVDKLADAGYKIWKIPLFSMQDMGLSTVLSTLSTEIGKSFAKFIHTVQKCVDKDVFGLLNNFIHRVLHSCG